MAQDIAFIVDQDGSLTATVSPAGELHLRDSFHMLLFRLDFTHHHCARCFLWPCAKCRARTRTQRRLLPDAYYSRRTGVIRAQHDDEIATRIGTAVRRSLATLVTLDTDEVANSHAEDWFIALGAARSLYVDPLKGYADVSPREFRQAQFLAAAQQQLVLAVEPEFTTIDFAAEQRAGSPATRSWRTRLRRRIRREATPAVAEPGVT